MRKENEEEFFQFIVDSAQKFCEGISFDKGFEQEFVKDGFVLSVSFYPEEKAKLQPKKTSKGATNPYGLVLHWNDVHQRMRKISYYSESNATTAKDMRIMSLLLKVFSAQDIRQMIFWFMGNYKNIKGYDGVPTIEGLYGFRQVIRDGMYLTHSDEEGEKGVRLT